MRRQLRIFSLVLAASALGLPSRGVAQAPLCPDRPNIVFILLDDFGWTSLPFLNPPAQWRAGDLPNPPGFRALQSPTYNRLDARLCALEGGMQDPVGVCPISLPEEEALALGTDAYFPASRSALPPEAMVASYSGVCEPCEGASCPACVPERDALPFRGGLRALAERGTMFPQFYAASAKCLPSRAAIVTGKHGNWTGAVDNGFGARLPREAPTFVKDLRERGGYRTGMIGKWHASGNPVGGPGEGFGDPLIEGAEKFDTCEDGFDEAIFYDKPARNYFSRKKLSCACARPGCPAAAGPATCACDEVGAPGGPDASPWALWGNREMPVHWVGGNPVIGKSIPGREDNCVAAVGPAHLAEEESGPAVRRGCPYSVRGYADLAGDFIRRNAGRTCSNAPSQSCSSASECPAGGSCTPPFFLMVSFTSVHNKHDAPKRTRDHYGTAGLGNRVRTSSYFAVMEETDAAIGAILDELESMGIDDETLVIFTSDQGPDGPELIFGNPQLRGGKGNVFEAGIRSPTIMKACSQSEGRVFQDLGSHVDLYRTVLDAAEVPVEDPPGTLIDGRSLWEEMRSGGWPPAPAGDRRDFAFARYGKDQGEIAVISRPGFFDGSTPPDWYELPEAKGVCAYIGDGDLTGVGDYGISRGPSEPLVLCDPDNGGAATCATVGDQGCLLVGGRCTGAPGEKLHDRPRCLGNADCGGIGTCEDPAPKVACNTCVRASWKLKTEIGNDDALPPKGGLFELSSDPEESRDFRGGQGVDSAADAQQVQMVEFALRGALERWKCSCLDPPPAPLDSGAVPDVGESWNQAGILHCKTLRPECQSWAPPDADLLP
jgi:arylsulfatase A-like enzyme